MTIKVIYDSKDFWGNYDFREETKEHAGADDLKKALRAMSKDRNFTVHIDNISIVWESYDNFDNRIVTVRIYEKWNVCDVKTMSWEKMKKYIKDMK